MADGVFISGKVFFCVVSLRAQERSGLVLAGGALAGGMPANAGLLATPVLPQDTNLKPSSVHAKCFSSDHTKQA